MSSSHADWRAIEQSPDEPANRRTATALAAALAARRLGATEVVEAHLAAIAAADDRLQAFITVDAAGARRRARELDAADAPVGPLHGIPVAIKDLTDTAGLRTTSGSLIQRDRIPAEDDLVVARLRAAGAIILGKTNTPEFGAGAVCSNRLRGPTANPFRPELTSGGSSGGSAVAVAAGLAPLAHGTDFGGSVRTPASFCGVVSIRPTPGLVPAPRRALGWDGLATHGVMARTIEDCALMLAAIEGPSPDDPLSHRVARLPYDGGPTRLAATADFGVATIAAEVRHRFAGAVARIAAVAGPVATGTPDCSDAAATFKTLRAAHIRQALKPLADAHPDAITDTVRWNIEAGARVGVDDYLAAEAARTGLWRRFGRLFREIDVLIAPAASVMPWPNADGEVTRIDGKPLGDILDYLAPTFVVSLVGYPVVTLPAPLDGLPFGVQLIGRPGEEDRLIALARQLGQLAGFVHVFPAGSVAAGPASSLHPEDPRP